MGWCWVLCQGIRMPMRPRTWAEGGVRRGSSTCRCPCSPAVRTQPAVMSSRDRHAALHSRPSSGTPLVGCRTGCAGGRSMDTKSAGGGRRCQMLEWPSWEWMGIFILWRACFGFCREDCTVDRNRNNTAVNQCANPSVVQTTQGESVKRFTRTPMRTSMCGWPVLTTYA